MAKAAAKKSVAAKKAPKQAAAKKVVAKAKPMSKKAKAAARYEQPGAPWWKRTPLPDGQ